MSQKVHKTLIGVFVVGGLGLLMMAIVVLGSGELFKRTNKFVLYFDGSVKGLAIGAPVMFRGVSIGTVKDISLIYDAKAGTITLPVIVEIQQNRIQGAPSFGEVNAAAKMIALGLRANLEVQSFLTGQLIISFNFYPEKQAKLRGIMNPYPELPTLPASADIAEIMNEIPIKEIAKNLNATSQAITALINSRIIPRTLDDFQNTLQETKRTMRSVSVLAEYLEQHPESLFKGKEKN